MLRKKKNTHGDGDDQEEVLLAAGFGLWIAVLCQVLAISAPAVTRTRRSQLEVEQQRLPLCGARVHMFGVMVIAFRAERGDLFAVGMQLAAGTGS